jgi:hypothetical protein
LFWQRGCERDHALTLHLRHWCPMVYSIRIHQRLPDSAFLNLVAYSLFPPLINTPRLRQTTESHTPATMRACPRLRMLLILGFVLLATVQNAFALVMTMYPRADDLFVNRDGVSCSDAEQSVCVSLTFTNFKERRLLIMSLVTCEDPSTCIHAVNGVFTCCTG